MYQAGLKAMRLAVEALPFVPDHVLVESPRSIPELTVQQTRYARGDGFVFSVAAALIVAKVYMDSVVRGYGAELSSVRLRPPRRLRRRARRSAALASQGRSSVHRLSFAPCHPASASHARGCGPWSQIADADGDEPWPLSEDGSPCRSCSSDTIERGHDHLQVAEEDRGSGCARGDQNQGRDRQGRRGAQGRPRAA